jgi:uncharacterized protein YhbP (UPF0306 family)
MAIKRSNKAVSARHIATLLRDLLEASTLCAIATVTPRGGAHINTAYFAWTRDFRLVWLSDPVAAHSINLRRNRSAAIAVFDSHQTLGQPDRGLQVFGSAGEVSGSGVEEIEGVYRARFPSATSALLTRYRFYVLRPRRIKIFDEHQLGAGVFVTASVKTAGEVAWQRTEIYETKNPEAGSRR